MKCLLCRSNSKNYLYTVNSYKVAVCQVCRLVFIDPLPSRRSIEEYYRLNFTYEGGFKQEKLIRKEAVRVLEKLRSMKIKNNPTILDIGCGAGFFLDEARRFNFQPFGVEPSEELARYASRSLKLNVIKGEFPAKKLQKKKFDVIILSQVIEHLTNPKIFLESVYQYLSDDGIFYLATPNIESHSAHILKKNFAYMTPPEHLFFFGPKTLSSLLNQVKFKVVSLGTYGYSQDLAGIFKQLIKRGERENHGKIRRDENQLVEEYPKNLIKLIKYILFDKIFCRAFYPLLNLNDMGSMIEIFAQKVNEGKK